MYWFRNIKQNPRVNTPDEYQLWSTTPEEYTDRLVQERRNSIANALELCLSCIQLSTSLQKHAHIQNQGRDKPDEKFATKCVMATTENVPQK